VLDGRRPQLFFIPAEVPDFLKQVVVNCWAQNPKDRPLFSGLWTYFLPYLYSPLVSSWCGIDIFPGTWRPVSGV